MTIATEEKYTTSQKMCLLLKGWKCISCSYRPTPSFHCFSCLEEATEACTGMKDLTVLWFSQVSSYSETLGTPFGKVPQGNTK